eukprot:scaffold1573_cov173-Amphora_coffeaeformis.AAC.12
MSSSHTTRQPCLLSFLSMPISQQELILHGSTKMMTTTATTATTYETTPPPSQHYHHHHPDNNNNNDDAYPRHVKWLPEQGFYALPAAFPLVSSQCYQDGRVYGQDVSSGAAVAALLWQEDNNNNNQPLRRILDLCCAPGQKLLALADGIILRHHNHHQQQHHHHHDDDSDGNDTRSNETTLVGVDVSADRLAVCQKALRKYYYKDSAATTPTKQDGVFLSSTGTFNSTEPQQPRIRLYCTDGTTFGQDINHRFSLIWDSLVAQQDVAAGRKRLNKSARQRQAKMLKAVADWDWNVDSPAILDRNSTTSTICNDHDDGKPRCDFFDAVLVDAECSTDGSIKHVQKRRRLEWTQERLPDLVDLQRRLAASGFRLLRPEGIMVYATCSLSTEQNEGVVSWLLQKMGSTAELVPVFFPGAPSNVRPGSIQGTIRFLPSENPSDLAGGGFFLAKIRKKKA